MATETLQLHSMPTTKTVAVEFNPFAGPQIERISPVTAPQAEIWLACLLGGEDANRAYNESVSLQFTGRVDRAALERALQEVVSRHEALRSAFSADGKYMCVFESLPIELLYQDISLLPGADNERAIAQAITTDAHHIFDLIHGPLVKASLLKVAETSYQFILTAHHIICDGWSTGIVLQDLSKLYSAYTQRLLPVLPPALAFSQYATEQQLFDASDEYARTEKFWLDQYSQSIPTLELPIDFPRPALRTYKSARLDFALNSDLVARVKKTGLKAGCSLVTTLTTCFEVLLHQLSSQETVVVGLPTAGQSATSNHHLVGHCVNLLPLKSHLTPNASFNDVLRQRKGYFFDAYEHQRLTFGKLLQKLNIIRDAARVPLVPVMFNIDMGLSEGVEFHNLHFQLRSNPRAFEAFELFLNASGSENSLILEWSYNTDLFKPETISSMMAEFEQLLEEVTTDPGIKISSIGKSRKESSQPVEQYEILNNTTLHFDSTVLIHHIISKQAKNTPNKTAIKFNDTEISYAHLDTQSNKIANYLLHNNVSPGDIIGISLERSHELIIALLAIIKCGATYLPLDPGYPQDRLDFMAADSGTALIITSSGSQSKFSTDARILYLEDIKKDAEDFSNESPAINIAEEDILYILYTSGSTGLPKGVQIKHHSIINFMHSMQRQPGISPDDRLLAITTISFDIAGLELFLPLTVGATVVVAEKQATRDGGLLLELLEKESITIMQATPSTWRMMLDAGWAKKFPLKVLCGGEALPPKLAEQLLAKCDSLWNLYGPTETTIWSTIKRIERTDEVITIGKPIANTQCYILDEFLHLAAPNATGELYIAGDGVAKGYLNRPELNDNKFISNPFSKNKGDKLYRTGDLAKLLPNGEVQCIGRTDQQIKIRGHRIELGEIENSITVLAGIKEAVVLAREDSNNNTRLFAYIVLLEPHTTNSNDYKVIIWKDHLATKLPFYMIPNEFIFVDSLPKTLNNKVDRIALLKQTQQPKKIQLARCDSPRTDVEKMVADIWKEQLQLNTIGIFDDFFKLGGHSLIAVQVMAQVEKRIGKRLPLSILFENSTVEKFASVLQLDSKLITWDSLVAIKPTGSKTPLYIVHGAGLNVLMFNALAKNMDPDQPVYGLQAKGLNGVDEPLTTIEAMAAHYITAIQTINPDGPYSLAGYSLGGIIAFEMAKQLIAAGKKVEILAMFDTYAYQYQTSESFLLRTGSQLAFSVKNALYTLFLLAKRPKKTIDYKIKSLKKLIVGKEKTYQAVFGHSSRIEEINEAAARNYQLVALDIKVDLFRVKETTFYMEDFTYLGWQPWALRGVAVHEIPGDHYRIFSPPNDDRESGRILQQVLNGGK